MQRINTGDYEEQKRKRQRKEFIEWLNSIKSKKIRELQKEKVERPKCHIRMPRFKEKEVLEIDDIVRIDAIELDCINVNKVFLANSKYDFRLKFDERRFALVKGGNISIPKIEVKDDTQIDMDWLGDIDIPNCKEKLFSKIPKQKIVMPKNPNMDRLSSAISQGVNRHLINSIHITTNQVYIPEVNEPRRVDKDIESIYGLATDISIETISLDFKEIKMENSLTVLKEILDRYEVKGLGEYKIELPQKENIQVKNLYLCQKIDVDIKSIGCPDKESFFCMLMNL